MTKKIRLTEDETNVEEVTLEPTTAPAGNT